MSPEISTATPTTASARTTTPSNRTRPTNPLSRPRYALAFAALLANAPPLAAADPLAVDQSAPRIADESTPTVATFSIIARDPETGELGIAVASKIPAVGAVVPYALAEVGAIATQAAANPSYGPDGLALLKAGKSPDEVVKILTAKDPESATRQFGIVASDGESATFTGESCIPNAGGLAGENFAVQGNILASEDVVEAIAETFKSTPGDLADRLLDALAAGQEKGGDRRGRQSAALLIVRNGWGYGGMNDRYRDLRVDDHESPIAELKRVYQAHKRIFRPRRIPKEPAPTPEE